MIKVLEPFFGPVMLAAGFSIPKFLEYDRSTMSLSLGLMVFGILWAKQTDK